MLFLSRGSLSGRNVSMHAEQRTRAQQELGRRGVERALFAHPATVKWLTGFAPAPQLGGTPFAGGPALVWYAGGDFVLITVDAYADEAAATGCPVVTYLGYTIEEPLAGAAHLNAALREAVGAVS